MDKYKLGIFSLIRKKLIKRKYVYLVVLSYCRYIFFKKMELYGNRILQEINCGGYDDGKYLFLKRYIM